MSAREEVVRVALDASPEKLREALAVLCGEAKTKAVLQPQGLLDVAGAMSYLGGCSRVSLWRHRRRGLKAIRLGGRIAFRISDLDRFINQMAGETDV